MRYKFLLLLLYVPLLIVAQQFKVSGRITDRYNKRPLPFANIQILNKTQGTSSNIDGEYLLRLKKGDYKLIASYIGYKPDTISLKISMDIPINFKLIRTSVKLDEITVLPKENPALEVIRRTIKTKQERNRKLNSYKFNAYTKGVIKTTQDITAGSNSVGVGLGEKDTAKLKITGILENESRGYFKKPNNYKDEIIAQKQSANFPSTINMLTGGRAIQNFYSDDIKFFGRELLSPIADDALEYYYYIIKDTLAIGNKTVFKIKFEPDYKSNPGFYGYLYITDNTFNLIKLDVNLNNAANPGGIFSRINIIQQYLPYDDSIYMPIDYRLFTKGNFLGMAKFAFEIESILYNYTINSKISDEVFDMVILKILPNADKKDSIYWKSNQKIPNSLTELEAYKRIDSVEAIPKTFWDRFSWLSTNIWLSKNFSTIGTVNFYHFNKVEGNAFSIGLKYYDSENKRLSSNFNTNYGFADKKLKWNFSGSYLLGKYRTTTVSFSLFNNLKYLFGSSTDEWRLLSTLTSLFGHYDYRDYYYSKGFSLNVTGAVLPTLDLGLGVSSNTGSYSNINTDFSLFNKEKFYKSNRQITKGNVVTLSTNFKLDFRKFIENGYFRWRTSQGKSYFTVDGKATFSNTSLLKSNLDFEIYNLNLDIYLNSFKSTKYIVKARGVYSSKAIPFQFISPIYGNIHSIGKDYTLRTIGFLKYLGDKTLTITTQYKFNDELFRTLRIPLLKDARLTLDAHLNVAWSSISKETKEMNATSFQNSYPQFTKPLYEIGFGIGHQLFPFKLEFTWRLNHRDENSFVIGLNAIMIK